MQSRLFIEPLDPRCFLSSAPIASTLAPGNDPAGAIFQAKSQTPTLQVTGTVTSVTFHGNHRIGPVAGSAPSIGSFTGSINAIVTRPGSNETATGTLTLVAANDDQLVISFVIVRPRGEASFIGSYTITQGTGRFSDARGEGIMTLTPRADGTADFTLDAVARSSPASIARGLPGYSSGPWKKGTKGW